MNLYQSIFKAFHEANIEYLIVGGVAVNLYGYNRFTGDIDILLALTPENLKKMDELMQNMGYIERVPASIKELGDSKKLEQFIQEKGMKAYTFISKDKPQLDIDVVVEASLDFSKYAANKTTVEVWNLPLPVIGIDDLIGMKKEADRDKDRLDLEALLKLKEL